jgi:hypothetical protein
MRRRLAGDAVWQWKSAGVRDFGQRNLEMSRSRRFSANCFMLRVIGSGFRTASLSFTCKRAREMHQCCGSTIAPSRGRIPSPPSPVHTFFVHLRQRGNGSNRVSSLNRISLANS